LEIVHPTIVCVAHVVECVWTTTKGRLISTYWPDA